jgi:hypothetical protein
MDGGTVLLKLTDSESKSFEVQFAQTMVLEKNVYMKYPGSLLLDNEYVPLRSNLERSIISSLKKVDIRKFNELDKQIIQGRISFVESDEYLEIAKKVGR